MIKLYCYNKCSTCVKAMKWLDNKKISYLAIDLKTNNPTSNEIKEIVESSNLDIKKFFNTSGLKYKELSLTTKIPNMTYQEKINLLASDGMLIKRPLIVSEKGILVGFKENEWETFFS